MAMDMTTALTIKANVVGQGQISGLQKGLGRVTGETKKATTAMGRLKGAAAGALGAMRSFLPVLGVAGIAAFAKNNLDAADSMSKLSQRTGIAAPTLDKFRKVAELSDTSIQSLERAFPALTKNMDNAAQKAKGPAFEAFQRLGVSVKDQSGKLRDADAVMLDIADRFQGMADGSEKAALASAVFGTRIGSELIPLLNSGGDAVRNMGTALTQEFADKAAAFNDRLENMQEKLGDLGLRITEALLPALNALVDFTEKAVSAFTAMPAPLQSIVTSVTLLGGAMLVLSPVLSAVTAAFSALAGLKIGATIAGFLPVIAQLAGALGGLGKIIVGVFSGPVGWITLAVAAGVAIYKFRNQIGKAFKAIVKIIKNAYKAFKKSFIDPILQTGKSILDSFSSTWERVYDTVENFVGNAFKAYKGIFIDPVLQVSKGLINSLRSIFQSIGNAVRAPFVAAFGFVKGVINNMLRAVASAINGVVGAINQIISKANAALGKLKLGKIPLLPKVGVPGFAEGGVVSGPTLAMVGEGGQREYIVPESKMARASANYLGGMRGKSVIPAFADGGVVGPGAAGNGMSGGAANTTVQITTGPVLQQDGTDYVTVGDLESALRSFGNQIFNNSRTFGGRRFQGIHA